MNKRGNLFWIILPFFILFAGIIFSSGCAHVEAPGKEFAAQSARASTVLAKRGDLVNAVEELKVALAVDPGNSALREELTRLIEKRDHEAESHYRSGLRMSESDPAGARKEFLKALRIRLDYPEAEKALRGVQLALAEAVIHARTKKEAALAELRMHGRSEVEEEEEDGGGEEYSLDKAISSFEAGDYEGAIREFAKMKARYPDDRDIQAYLDRSWYNSGITYFNKKDYARALTSFAKLPKGFERVDEYTAKCRSALGSPEGGKVKPVRNRR